MVTDAVAAIAHEGRRALLRLVLSVERSAGDLAIRVGMKQPAASQHLTVLREAGLVTVRVDGPRRMYRVDFAGLARLRAELDDFWEPSLLALKEAAERGDWP
ncbi:MAG TPA: metalloregulator ArsR/SmtB family transcription factor [Actinomycetota bacterium]|jgi:DNA-binding transcriptional ArsR family regulator|nr:metalloregulator ArsR/SmtB family transcription factor [Actinomycetota bacterium]